MSKKKAEIIKQHYDLLGKESPFILPENGKFKWLNDDEFPTDETLAVWKSENENFQALKDQEKKLLGYIEKYAYHVTEHTPDSGRRFASQYQVWKDKILLWESQLMTVKSGTLVEISPIPTF